MDISFGTHIMNNITVQHDPFSIKLIYINMHKNVYIILESLMSQNVLLLYDPFQ